MIGQWEEGRVYRYGFKFRDVSGPRSGKVGVQQAPAELTQRKGKKICA